ncbi:hypothetical protein AOLI_G00011320 [Acnodon oligacanthus]
MYCSNPRFLYDGVGNLNHSVRTVIRGEGRWQAHKPTAGAPALAVPVTEQAGHHKHSKPSPVRRPESGVGGKRVDFGAVSALNDRVEAGESLKAKTSDMCVSCRCVFSFSEALVTKPSELTRSSHLLSGAASEAEVTSLTAVAQSEQFLPTH